MKFRYDKEDDILMIWLSKKKIDYAEQSGDLIVHFSKSDKPVLLEILEASKFLKQASEILPSEVKSEVLAV